MDNLNNFVTNLINDNIRGVNIDYTEVVEDKKLSLVISCDGLIASVEITGHYTLDFMVVNIETENVLHTITTSVDNEEK